VALLLVSCENLETKPSLAQTPTLATAPSATNDIVSLLANVPEGAAWQDLSADLQQQFAQHARQLLDIDRANWGLAGLSAKAAVLSQAPTPAMQENINRILSTEYNALLPNGFVLARDIKHPGLKNALLQLYLLRSDDRHNLLFNHPEFRGWDGNPIKEFKLLDHQHIASIAGYAAALSAQLDALPNNELSRLEQAIKAKTYFATRELKHFDHPPVGQWGSFSLATTYAWPTERRPYSADKSLLDAYNASMFAEFTEVNRGTIDAFLQQYEYEFTPIWLKAQGMPSELISAVLKLGNLYKTRISQHPLHDQRCTLYTAEQRAQNWDAFTGSQLANADGSETLESYAQAYTQVAAERLTSIKAIAKDTLASVFPNGDPLLSSKQRQQVLAEIDHTSQPAQILVTLYTALDHATGASAASQQLKAAENAQVQIGGYSNGEALRKADEQAILEMWNKVRNFLIRQYSGYPVDLGKLIPERPTLSTSSETSFADGGNVNISLIKASNKASLYSTLLHEIKHAIDQNSHAAVEGAAWEGGAVSVERAVWPQFIETAMQAQAKQLPLAKLLTAIDDVRVTATTDATLKIYTRTSCTEQEPDTIDYVKQIVAGYGYTDPEVLALRSKRAHASTQYLQYDYGLFMYEDLLKYLQAGIGSKPKVDAYLLQACGMPSPLKTKASIQRLAACIHSKR
jgi:hypothetical protein